MELESKPMGSTGLILSSVVNHKIRCLLDLTCDQYVVANFIHHWRRTRGKQPAFSKDIKRNTGFDLPEFFETLKSMDGDVVKQDENKKWSTTDRWDQYFNFEQDFEEFWEIWKKRGNRAKSLEVYLRAREVVGKEDLHTAAKRKVATVDELKYLPHATTWLNPKYKSWEEVLPLADNENVKQDGDFSATTD